MGNPSIISLFSAFDVASPSGEPIRPNAIAPKQWKVFTMWSASDDEIGKDYTQKLSIYAPDGNEFGRSEMSFKMEKRAHTTKARVLGMPVGVEGNIVIKL